MAASLGRPLIAKRLVEIAHREGADAVAHGATGKGNDQIQFYAGVMALDPSLRVIAPVMEWDLTTRSKQLEFAATNGIETPPFKTSPYSRDSNLWGTSVECGVLDDLEQAPPEDAYTLTAAPDLTPDEPVAVEIAFQDGTPVALDGEPMEPADLVARLNAIGGAQGVGRLDIIENRLVGFKVRGVYESPAAEILFRAMRELENLVLDRDLLHAKTWLSQRYAELIYDGKWFGGARTALDGFFESFADRLTGAIQLRLSRGWIDVLARRSPFALYDLSIASYESDHGFDQSAGGASVGLSGKDSDLIVCEPDDPALGHVGRPIRVNAKIVKILIERDVIPVISPVGTGLSGETFNVNGDIAAGAIAAALKADRLLLLTDVAGVKDAAGAVIPRLTPAHIRALIADGVIKGGMIPKIHTALEAIASGVAAVAIIDGVVDHTCLLELFTEGGAGSLILDHEKRVPERVPVSLEAASSRLTYLRKQGAGIAAFDHHDHAVHLVRGGADRSPINPQS